MSFESLGRIPKSGLWVAFSYLAWRGSLWGAEFRVAKSDIHFRRSFPWPWAWNEHQRTSHLKLLLLANSKPKLAEFTRKLAFLPIVPGFDQLCQEIARINLQFEGWQQNIQNSFARCLSQNPILWGAQACHSPKTTLGILFTQEVSLCFHRNKNSGWIVSLAISPLPPKKFRRLTFGFH